MKLIEAIEGKEYIIKSVETGDEELDDFLFSLGCYAGQPITVVSRKKGGYVISVKDSRYNIDKELAEAIKIWSNRDAERRLFFDNRLAYANFGCEKEAE